MFFDDLMKYSELLLDLGKFSGLSFHWHFVDNTNVNHVPRELHNQLHRLCAETKRLSGKMLNRCINDHHNEGFRRGRLTRKPFLLHCHAGLLEVGVPIFAAGELFGVLYGGVFASLEGPSYAVLKSEYAKLPGISDEKLLALGNYLSRLWDQTVSSVPPQNRGTSELLPQLATDDPRLIRAAGFMRLHRNEKHSLKRIAQESGLSASRFSHLFSMETGFSVRDWMLRLKVGDAQRLIEASSMPFGKIAELCAVGDASRLTVLIKRYFGCTPAELRRRAKNELRLRRAPRIPAADDDAAKKDIS